MIYTVKCSTRSEGDLNITITDEYYSKDELDNKMQTSSIAGDMPDAVVADYLLIPNIMKRVW